MSIVDLCVFVPFKMMMMMMMGLGVFSGALIKFILILSTQNSITGCTYTWAGHGISKLIHCNNNNNDDDNSNNNNDNNNNSNNIHHPYH